MRAKFSIISRGWICAVALGLAGAVGGWAQGIGQGKTADELYLEAINAYNSAQYPEAAAGFQKFLSDFGSSEQGQLAAAAIRYPLAMSLLHLEKFPEAQAVIEEALAAEPPPSADQREQLIFYLGVCQMQGDEAGAARETFGEFVTEFPRGRQTPEAYLLGGTTLLLEGKNAEAAEHFAAVKGRLDPVSRGRATVLEFYGLLEADQTDAALALVVEEFPRMNQMLQVATFQMLALQLGSDFLEKEEYRKAIQCLQRVWSSDRLLKHQQQRLDDMEDALAAAETQPQSDPYRKFQLKQMITKVRLELQNFAGVESFDAALRLRLASAFLGMERFREAALILEEMLTDMPPDKVVESASVTLVQSWQQIERWEKVVAAAAAFEEKFPKSEQLPLVLYMKGIAQQRENDQAAAIATFVSIQERFPESEYAPRAVFMEGFSQLLAEQNVEAVETFAKFAKENPEHELRDPAAYWRGMGFSLNKQYPEARAAMDEYLAAFPEGAFRGLAVFRKAFAAQSMPDYPLSIREFRDYLVKYPGHESNSEALLLLGDAYMSEGEMDLGMAAFKRIPPEETKFYEEGWFKVGKALRLLEDREAMRAHFEEFREANERSPRVAEAIYWIGWTHRQDGDTDSARKVYWDAIREWGNDSSIRSVDDLFPALGKLYEGDEERAQYFAELRDLREEADREEKDVLAMRALWAQAQALVRSEPTRAQEAMIEAAERVDVPNTNPLLLADFASAYEAAGRTEEAEQMWKDLVKWNPRAPQKDRAFAALGMAEMARGNERAALDYFERFERDVRGSVLLGRILLAKAALLGERGQYDDARATLEVLLTSPSATGQEKAQALFAMGETYMAQEKPELAVPYFQRIYIMHGRWTDWVAKAYVRSGAAFEALKDTEAARKTYEEMTRLDRLKEFPEMDEAQKRLDALGGPVEEL